MVCCQIESQCRQMLRGSLTQVTNGPGSRVMGQYPATNVIFMALQNQDFDAMTLQNRRSTEARDTSPNDNNSRSQRHSGRTPGDRV
jgi:hypothetical protein